MRWGLVFSSAVITSGLSWWCRGVGGGATFGVLNGVDGGREASRAAFAGATLFLRAAGRCLGWAWSRVLSLGDGGGGGGGCRYRWCWWGVGGVLVLLMIFFNSTRLWWRMAGVCERFLVLVFRCGCFVSSVRRLRSARLPLWPQLSSLCPLAPMLPYTYTRAGYTGHASARKPTRSKPKEAATHEEVRFPSKRTDCEPKRIILLKRFPISKQ